MKKRCWKVGKKGETTFCYFEFHQLYWIMSKMGEKKLSGYSNKSKKKTTKKKQRRHNRWNRLLCCVPYISSVLVPLSVWDFFLPPFFVFNVCLPFHRLAINKIEKTRELLNSNRLKMAHHTVTLQGIRRFVVYMCVADFLILRISCVFFFCREGFNRWC